MADRSGEIKKVLKDSPQATIDAFLELLDLEEAEAKEILSCARSNDVLAQIATFYENRGCCRLLIKLRNHLTDIREEES